VPLVYEVSNSILRPEICSGTDAVVSAQQPPSNDRSYLSVLSEDAQIQAAVDVDNFAG
jgi:hypothetical protein